MNRINALYQTAPGRRMIIAGGLVIIVAVSLVNAAVTSGRWQPEQQPVEPLPKLIIEDSVASDFKALAVETWDKFLYVFQARAGCFGDVRLRASRTLVSRAAYDPKNAIVTVRVPGTPAMLKGALVHEWAHHLEFQCKEHQELRQAFLAAQGLPPGTPWRPDTTPAQTPESAWADIPSEQYAEATIEVVLGSRQIPTKVLVTREAVQVVEVWAAGGD